MAVWHYELRRKMKTQTDSELERFAKDCAEESQQAKELGNTAEADRLLGMSNFAQLEMIERRMRKTHSGRYEIK